MPAPSEFVFPIVTDGPYWCEFWRPFFSRECAFRQRAPTLDEGGRRVQGIRPIEAGPSAKAMLGDAVVEAIGSQLSEAGFEQ
jgi:hypothetical protein